MAKIFKCDKCKKVIKGKKGDISINSPEKFFEDGHYYKNFEFCENCFKKSSKALVKIFPEILKNNK
jgi:hypothetical protein